MKKKYLLLLALLVSCHLAYGQGPLGAKPKRARTVDDYKPRTLKEITIKVADGDSISNKEETMIVQPSILPSRVRVTYTGSSRPLPDLKKELLGQWALRYAGYPEFYTAPYETEMLFDETGSKYWLAVRKEARPKFELDLKNGEKVDLFLIRMGAVKTSSGWESLLLVEKFQKTK